jgi:23S rRNA pseudouridine1911/1915/1917 synthase
MILISEESGIRLDKWLSEQIEELSRAYIQKLIDEGQVLLNGKPAKASAKVNIDDQVELEIPKSTVPDIVPEDIPLDIVYEDSDVIVVNKPKGMVVHPAAGHYTGTLVNALMYHCGESLSGINGVSRPGIVHRIDRDTTGLLIACKNDHAHLKISEQLKAHTISRRYRAIVTGILKDDEGTIIGNIARHKTDRKKMAVVSMGGREAITHYRVLERLKKHTYVECRLETGRTHQIRVHMAYIGHPLLGDTVYGSGKDPYKLEGQCLHAMVLGFVHPTSGEYMEFSAPLPEYFSHLLEIL